MFTSLRGSSCGPEEMDRRRMRLTAPTQLACGAESWDWKPPMAPTSTDVMVPEAEGNPLVMPQARHVLAFSETTQPDEHCAGQ
ncbi:hypothetical protein KUCAC02_024320 [Chaenocephalus aceratus]|uniref:Uncharacterized protein n=1 Tax=Chaenocephalus aceratus TaxID=36190 RepID=A0ACB9WHN0_CHAAC|nr:hypothetical protein KUCAC02_024320 [Chaenocephalus aceratus]